MPFHYDAANRRAVATDPLGNTLTTVYDAAGNAIAAVDQLGQRWTRSYDRLNRVVAESDPLGNTKRTCTTRPGACSRPSIPTVPRTCNVFDGRGRLIQWMDAAGAVWRYAYDGVGNITNITDALGEPLRDGVRPAQPERPWSATRTARCGSIPTTRWAG